ncbi:hypothetical protein [Saliniramus sp.]|uniref:hypothetical protein n=1 Tax=Saliniramus sp. TaxID=2986772 RepID=UPI002D1FB49A|nr:hypothetical protein [Saliniramus sp.]
MKHVVFVSREPERLCGLGIAVICMPEVATTNSCKRIASLRGSICDFALPVKDKGRGAPRPFAIAPANWYRLRAGSMIRFTSRKRMITSTMRAEFEALVETAKQSIGLLRRHL